MRAVDVERHPRIAGEARRRDTPELPAHDANHLAPLAVEDDRLPHDGGRAAELRSPQAFADDDSTATRVIRTQGAAEERHGAERVEVVGGHQPEDTRTARVERQRYLRVPLRDDVREDGVALPDVSDVRPRCRALAGVDANDFVRAAKRQRLQKQRVEDAEGGRAAADRHGKRQHGGRREPLVPQQQSNAIFVSRRRSAHARDQNLARSWRWPSFVDVPTRGGGRRIPPRPAPCFGLTSAMAMIGRAHLEAKCDLIPHVVLDIVSSVRHEAEQPSTALRSHTDHVPLTWERREVPLTS